MNKICECTCKFLFMGPAKHEEVGPREGPVYGTVPWTPSGERIQRNAKHSF